jgi:N-acetylneuraminate synthase
VVKKIFIIAEVGVNHNGSLDRALQLVDAAADAGADAVKFQTFKAENLVSQSAPKARYQMLTTEAQESQFAMLKKLELDENAHTTLIRHCKERGIAFLSTPFDLDSLAMLTQRFGISLLKLSSGDITNAPLLVQSARSGKPIILSTGMSSLGEIERALGVLAFGYINGNATPSLAAFEHAYRSDEGRRVLQEKVTLLHCTTEYPAPFDEVNLNAMATMRTAFGVEVGYSDHTVGIAIPVAAAALGACVIEKHFTLDRTLPGPDHKASLEPRELMQMVRAVREVELALGSSIKLPTASELQNRIIARKSIVASRPIHKGELFSLENITCKRPGGGVDPIEYWNWLGQVALRDYAEDELVKP